MKLVAHATLAALAACLASAPAAAAAPPSASFTVSPAAPHTLETVTFTSTSTGDITSQSWDLDNQGGCNDATGPTRRDVVPDRRAPTGSRSASPAPTARPRRRRTSRSSNQEPLVSFIHLPARAEVGETVSFVSTSQDPDGSITRQAWDLDGDGAFDDGTDVNVSRAFSRPGRYAVSLRVTDSNGARVTLTETISVRAPLLDPFPTVGMEGIVADDSVRIDMFRVNAPPGARVQDPLPRAGLPAATGGGGVQAAALQASTSARSASAPCSRSSSPSPARSASTRASRSAAASRRHAGTSASTPRARRLRKCPSTAGAAAR